jgi:hypothetical protein
MTAIEDARATADTLRDVDCEDRGDMIQAIERAERDIRALIAEHECLPAPPSDEWEYAIKDGAGLHAWPFGPQDEELAETLEACVKALDGNNPDFWNPDDHIVRRRKAGAWEEMTS